MVLALMVLALMDGTCGGKIPGSQGHNARPLAHMAIRRGRFAAVARINASGLARDIAIVELLADSAEPLGVSTIARQLNRDLTQTSRALSTLAEAGIVHRDLVTRGYRPGWRVAAIGARSMEARLAEVARPHLRNLASTLNETAMLAVVRSSQTIVIAAQISPHGLGAYARIGSSYPAASSSTARVVMAGEPEDSWADWFTEDRLEEAGERCAVRSRQDWVEQLQHIRDVGAAVTWGEYEDGVVNISAAVRGSIGRPIAAVSISAPEFRFADHVDTGVRLVKRAALRVTEAITRRD